MKVARISIEFEDGTIVYEGPIAERFREVIDRIHQAGYELPSLQITRHHAWCVHEHLMPRQIPPELCPQCAELWRDFPYDPTVRREPLIFKRPRQEASLERP